jgi:hypothetical protein
MTHSIGWRALLRALVRQGKSRTYPLLAFSARPPSLQPWPASLAPCPPLQEFYGICDGGYLAHWNLASLEDVRVWTNRWVDTMRGWRDGADVLDPLRHIVFGNDAGGCPLIVDTQSGEVRTYQVDGGDWESGWSSLEAFFEWLFFSEDLDDWSGAMTELGRPTRARIP